MSQQQEQWRLLTGDLPRIDVTKPAEYESLLQKYGAADFRQVVQRNVEKDFIERTAALLSVAEMTSVFKSINNLHVIMERSANGGVIAQYPIDGPTGNTGQDTTNGPLIPKTIVLDRANVTYRIMHEALLEGGEPAENDAVLEGAEQLGAKMDDHYLTELIAKKLAANDVNGTAWLGAGDPFDDINKAINLIVENSAINPNSKADAWFTVIVPIKYRVALEKITIVDGLKIGLSELIKQRLGAQIIYSRPPFRIPASATPWAIVDEAIVIPTKDRHVGKFYTFDGGSALPSIFVTSDENGKRVSTNSWMKFAVTPSESDGSLTENRRIGVINTLDT